MSPATTLSRRQLVTTAGNATLIAYDEGPILCTDPWIGDEEPAHFGSWVLSHEIPHELKGDIYRAESGSFVTPRAASKPAPRLVLSGFARTIGTKAMLRWFGYV